MLEIPDRVDLLDTRCIPGDGADLTLGDSSSTVIRCAWVRERGEGGGEANMLGDAVLREICRADSCAGSLMGVEVREEEGRVWEAGRVSTEMVDGRVGT